MQISPSIELGNKNIHTKSICKQWSPRTYAAFLRQRLFWDCTVCIRILYECLSFPIPSMDLSSPILYFVTVIFSLWAADDIVSNLAPKGLSTKYVQWVLLNPAFRLMSVNSLCKQGVFAIGFHYHDTCRIYWYLMRMSWALIKWRVTRRLICVQDVRNVEKTSL